jgi:hypothetical protein
MEARPLSTLGRCASNPILIASNYGGPNPAVVLQLEGAPRMRIRGRAVLGNRDHRPGRTRTRVWAGDAGVRRLARLSREDGSPCVSSLRRRRSLPRLPRRSRCPCRRCRLSRPPRGCRQRRRRSSQPPRGWRRRCSFCACEFGVWIESKRYVESWTSRASSQDPRPCCACRHVDSI